MFQLKFWLLSHSLFSFYVVCVSQFSLMLDDIWFEGIWKYILDGAFSTYASTCIIFEISWHFLGLAFQALLSLCAIALCVSAYQDSSFGAVIIAAVCWGLPVLIRMFFGGIIWLIVDSMPIFLVMPGIVNDIYEVWYIVLGINICFAIGCLVKGLVSYKTKQFA